MFSDKNYLKCSHVHWLFLSSNEANEGSQCSRQQRKRVLNDNNTLKVFYLIVIRIVAIRRKILKMYPCALAFLVVKRSKRRQLVQQATEKEAGPEFLDRPRVCLSRWTGRANMNFQAFFYHMKFREFRCNYFPLKALIQRSLTLELRKQLKFL